jgi:hypothetical protein
MEQTGGQLARHVRALVAAGRSCAPLSRLRRLNGAAEGPVVQRLDNNDFGFRCRTRLVTLNLWTKNSSDG